MSLQELRISADAYLVCLTHVLSTESTEVMGVLLGDVNDQAVCRVLSAKVLVRLDKRKDRVEISPSQLMSAAGEADQLSVELGRPVRVVGWYHSHPHITVWPSVVDIGTQDSFQLMDSCFAGLIFAVFPKRQSAGVQVTCFQSARDDTGDLKRRDVPIRIEPTRTIAPHCLRALVDLPEALQEEEVASYDAVQEASAEDQLTEMHNQAVLVRNTTQQLGVLTLPLLQLLENRLQRNQRQLRRLLAERDALVDRLGDRTTVKRELDAREAERANTVAGRRRNGESASREREAGAESDSSTETVFLPSAAERELGVSPCRRRLRLDSNSDSAASVELTRQRRRPVVKRERDSGAEGSEPEPGRQRRRPVVKRERDSGAEESEPEPGRQRRRPVVKRERDSGAEESDPGRQRRRLAVVKEEPDSRDSDARSSVKRERQESAGAGRPQAAPTVKQEPDGFLDVSGSLSSNPREAGDAGLDSPGKRTRASVKREPTSPARDDRRRTSRGDVLK